MRFDVTASGMAALMHDIEGDIAGAATGAMRESTPDAKQRLREQVTAAGLGNRLANTWRGESYPKGRASVNPAGFIWSNAPDIIDSFNRGAQIVPHAGRKFLAIPTRNVPRSRGRGTRKAMSFEQVEHEFNQDMFFKRGRAGRVLAFVNAINGRRNRGVRAPTKGRIAQGRAVKPVLMFVLVPTVRIPKLLDIEAVAEQWAQRFERGFTERLSRL